MESSTNFPDFVAACMDRFNMGSSVDQIGISREAGRAIEWGATAMNRLGVRRLTVDDLEVEIFWCSYTPRVEIH